MYYLDKYWLIDDLEEPPVQLATTVDTDADSQSKTIKWRMMVEVERRGDWNK